MERDVLPEPPSKQKRLSVSAQIEALSVRYRRYIEILLPFARRQLRNVQIPEAEYSDEDLIQSSFGTLVEDIIKGKTASIDGLDDFLKLLRRIIVDKVFAVRDRMDALKRGGAGIKRRHGKVPDSDPPIHGTPRRERLQVADDLDLFHIGLSRNEIHDIFSDTILELLSLLDVKNRIVALMRIKGHTIAEIAKQVGVSTRTIDRRLEEIRVIWSKSGMLELDWQLHSDAVEGKNGYAPRNRDERAGRAGRPTI